MVVAQTTYVVPIVSCDGDCIQNLRFWHFVRIFCRSFVISPIFFYKIFQDRNEQN